MVLVGLILAPLSAASVDGLKLHSASAGKGNAALIFVHGWTCDSSSWTAQVAEFAKNYRVLTLDLPGHGQSAGPADGKFSIGLFARAVEAVRAEAGVERVVLVGHSMGAPVIREYARLFPQHVAGLVAVDGPLDLRGFGEAREGRGAFTPPPMTGPDGLKAREGMIKGMFTPQTPKPLQDQIMLLFSAVQEVLARPCCLILSKRLSGRSSCYSVADTICWEPDTAILNGADIETNAMTGVPASPPPRPLALPRRFVMRNRRAARLRGGATGTSRNRYPDPERVDSAITAPVASSVNRARPVTGIFRLTLNVTATIV